MKRITTLVLAVAMMLSAAAVAFADGIDVKVKGQWDFAFGWAANNNFTDNVNRKAVRSNDDFIARHRIRTQVNFISSESLQAVLMFEIGTINWGRKANGGALDADGVNVETKRAYLDWIIPNTEISVRMGIQGLKLPSTPMGSPMFDADIAGIVISSPITEWLSATVLWARPFDAYYNDSDAKTGSTSWGNKHLDDEVDLFGLLLPMSGDGWSFTPWGVYAFIGSNSGIHDYMYAYRYENTVNVQNSHTKAWYAGAHFELSMFEPLVFNIEGIYGRLSQSDIGGLVLENVPGGLAPNTWAGAKGWFIGATLDYKLDFMTPGIFGWYASGDTEAQANAGWLGRLPALGADGGSFYPTSFGFAGSFCTGIATDGQISNTGTGHWGVGLQFKDISFIEDLTHTLRFAYYRGTNDEEVIKKFGNVNRGYFRFDAHDPMYLTKKDSVWEINFDHQYKIYENLTMGVELGWLRLNSDEDVWRGVRGNDEDSNAWKAQVMFKYTF